MQITDYLNLYDSYVNTLIETNPTDFTKESLCEVVIDTIVELTPLRLDEDQTNKLITSVLNKYRRAVRFHGEIDHYEDSVDSNLLSSILLRYCKREKSFYYAYVLLQQEINGRIAFPEDIIFLSEQEIEDAVLEDMKSMTVEKNKPQITFKDLLIHDRIDLLMNQLHELLDYKKGKDVATVIKAMEKLHFLKPYSSVKNLHTLITREFGDIGSIRNFSNYINEATNYNIQQVSLNKVIVILQTV